MSVEHSCRWLLKELEKLLGYHLTSTCTQKKHGTVLSHTGGDLMHALSSALSKSDTKHDPISSILENSACTCTIEEKISKLDSFQITKYTT